MSNVLFPVDTRRQHLRALKTRYQAASQAEKTRILEEFILISGYHRKSPKGEPHYVAKIVFVLRWCSLSGYSVA